MLDIKFDIVAREIIWLDTDPNGFVLTDNPSEQNGGILQFSRAAILQSPISGIGIEEVINSGITKTTYEMNRWKNQAIADGATVANWKATPNANDVLIEVGINYE
jgi:hypothetical protein